MKKYLTLEEIQKESLNILTKIDEICRKEGITYYLAYGTLIGAIRHKGIIPWDDDIDIMMPRPDYDRLEAYFVEHKDELFPLEIMGPNTKDDYPYMINRVSNKDFVVETDNEKSFGLGVFMDIYPLDAMGNTLEEAYKLKKKSCALASLCFLSTRERLVKGNTKSVVKLVAKLPAFCLAKIIGKKTFFSKLNKLAQTYEYDKANYVGCLIWAADDGCKGVYKKEWLNNRIEHEFEGMKFFIPGDYDSILKQLYGDYMTPPPENDRYGHHFYKAYRREKND